MHTLLLVVEVGIQQAEYTINEVAQVLFFCVMLNEGTLERNITVTIRTDDLTADSIGESIVTSTHNIMRHTPECFNIAVHYTACDTMG